MTELPRVLRGSQAFPAALLGTPQGGLSIPPPPPINPPGRERDLLLLEWVYTPITMAELVDETLQFHDLDTGTVFRGHFEPTGLELTEVLDGKDGFVALDAPFLLTERTSSYPMMFFVERLMAVIEVMDCGVEIEEGKFICSAHDQTIAARYDLRLVGPEEELPDTLWCVDGCPKPSVDPREPYFPRQPSDTKVELQVVEYAFNAEDGLVFENEQVIPEPGFSLATGPLYAPYEENLDALRCDLNGDGANDEVCTWMPVTKFFTVSINARSILPYRSEGIYLP